MYHPRKEEFLRQAERGGLIPIYKEILSDTYTPLSVYKRLEGREKFSFLLESVEKGERWGRYSFLGTNPEIIFKSKGTNIEIIRDKEIQRLRSEEPLSELKRILDRYSPDRREDLPCFFGGWVGYIGYDTIRLFEPVVGERKENIDDLSLPDIFLLLAKELLLFDHLKQSLKVVVNVQIEGDSERVYEQAIGRIEEIIKQIREPVKKERTFPYSFTCLEEKNWQTNITREEFERGVEKAKEYIREGEIIQVVLSQRWETELDCSPLDIYRALRCANPSPYMFFLDFGEVKLIGSSPEILVRAQEGRAETRPIAGTRRRGESEEEDRRLEKELVEDPKERAEHIMLVDLGRNDLSKVCEYGSVSVSELMRVEKYSYVMHIVSHCEGRLRKDRSIFDLFQACFPAGTVTGAPKIRAMQIIEELEKNKRSVYAGAVGYFAFSGNMDSCITIRTILIKGDRVYVQAGAGIVADSDPKKEYEETVNKAKAMKQAVEIARAWDAVSD